MYSSDIAFNKFVKDEEVGGIKVWLLNGFQGSNFAPFPLDFEPSAPVQLEYRFTKLENGARKIFTDATIEATSDWTFEENYGPETLKQLVILAAYIGANGIISVLHELIESKRLKQLEEEELKGKEIDDGTTGPYTYTMRYVVGVLQGFAPSKKAKMVLEELFVSDCCERFAAQLFLGLCECTKEEYAKYVPVFLGIEERHPDYFSMFHIMHEFARIVPLKMIKDNLKDLEPRWKRERFLELLCMYDWSPHRDYLEEFTAIDDSLFQAALDAEDDVGVNSIKKELKKELAALALAGVSSGGSTTPAKSRTSWLDEDE